MDVRRGIYLGTALLLGTALATAIGFWEEQSNAQQAAQFGKSELTPAQAALASPPAGSTSPRQVEYISRAVGPGSDRPDGPQAIDDPQVVPASYEQPDRIGTGEPSNQPTGKPAQPAEQSAQPGGQTPDSSDQSAVERSTLPAQMPMVLALAGELGLREAEPVRQVQQVEEPHPQLAQTAAAEQPAAASGTAEPAAIAGDVPLAWHDNYRLAMDAAVEQQRMMLIYFYDPQGGERQAAFERDSFGDTEVHKQLNRDYVLARLPLGAAITSSGERIELLKHASFFEMRGHSGIAILDFAHPQAEYFGTVVSAFPLMSGKYYSQPKLATVLSLPAGTLTQRTMIYAVRVHPEAPASTQGQFNGVLADEATRHSQYQATILVQGHHNWDSRFHRINSRLSNPVLAEEVVAESWPSENLVEACIDCVDSWRHSPGHWQAVRSRHRLFGFDIHRGRNGIWYATGIFSQH